MFNVNLILEGGGMRGVYTSGVLDYFIEKNIEFEFIIGVSAGACNATSYISKQKGRNFKIVADYVNDKRYMGINNLVYSGNFLNPDFIFDTIPNELNLFDYKEFNKFNGRFISVSTNLNTGLADYHLITNLKNDNDMLYLNASMSLPLIAQPIKIDNKLLLDGGVADSIPIEKALELGHKKSVVILTQDPNYRKEQNKMLPLFEEKYQHYPNFINAIKNRHNCYNNQLNYVKLLQKTGDCFVIQPQDPVKISRIEKNEDKLQALYDEGYNDAKNCFNELLEFLKKSDD